MAITSFDWDSANIAHIARHKVTPEEAEQVIANNPFEIGRVLRNGEERIVHLGETDAGRILLVPVTLRDGRVRVVTAHDVDHKYREFYSTQKANANETDPDNT